MIIDTVLDISNVAYMLYMTLYILIVIYAVTFAVRIMYILEKISKQAFK